MPKISFGFDMPKISFLQAAIKHSVSARAHI